MKIQKPENENYAATVVALQSIIELEGCDNVVGTPIFGFQAIVGKDSKPGDLGIVFPAESQLSVEYCKENNLFRHADLNKDESQKGYIEDNRRVICYTESWSDGPQLVRLCRSTIHTKSPMEPAISMSIGLRSWGMMVTYATSAGIKYRSFVEIGG
jgi:hypothetical protein